MLFHCWQCGARIDYAADARVDRRDTCPQCSSDLRSCRNCRFYDPSKVNHCAEPKAAPVRNKASANLCEFFTPNPTLDA